MMRLRSGVITLKSRSLIDVLAVPQRPDDNDPPLFIDISDHNVVTYPQLELYLSNEPHEKSVWVTSRTFYFPYFPLRCPGVETLSL